KTAGAIANPEPRRRSLGLPECAPGCGWVLEKRPPSPDPGHYPSESLSVSSCVLFSTNQTMLDHLFANTVAKKIWTARKSTVAPTGEGGVADGARRARFGLDMLLADLSKPERIFATRRDAEAFIASELRKCSRSGRNAERGYWWGNDYQSRRGVRVRFEMYDE